MITTAELFVAQTHLALDDPDGPYTAGSASEIVDWISQHTIATTTVLAHEGRPTHHIIDLDDDSAVVAVIGQSTQQGRVADLSEIAPNNDWGQDDPGWVLVGGQPQAHRYLRMLGHVIANTPHPADVIRQPLRQPANEWANTMVQASQGKAGREAAGAANVEWDQIRRHRNQVNNARR